MLVYIIVIFITGGCAVYYDLGGNRRGKDLWWTVIYVYLILILGLRFEVGGDTINYMGDYLWRTPLSNWSFNLLDPYQPGYTLICSLGKSISQEFYVFQFIHAIILNSLLFYFIIKNTKYRFSALFAIYFICYLYFTTEILRESIAVMIFVLNYKSYKNRCWMKYYLGVLLCCCFHISACFLLILPFLSTLKVNKTYVVVFLVALVCMFFTRNILASFTEISMIGDKINGYIDDTTHGLLSDILSVTRRSLFPLLYCIVVKLLCKRDIKYENMIAIMCLFGMASFFNGIIFSRFVNYFILFFSISISSFCISYIKSNKKIIKEYAYILSIIFFMLYGSEFYMYDRYKRWIPYYSIYNPVSVNRDSYN